MLTSQFNYNLPAKLIAQKPLLKRDLSRLLVLDKNSGQTKHCHFFDLPKLLQPNDVLVFNNSKVFKARLTATKPTGGKLEIFLLREINASTWEAMIGGRGGDVGLVIKFNKNLSGKIIKQNENLREIKFNLSGKKLQAAIDKLGAIPLPPYIKQTAKLDRYQTVYAKTRGSVAAPTAGLHFTKKLLAQLKKKHIQLEYVTLHVGLGTFAPIKADKIENHKIHTEFATVDSATAKRLNQYKKQGRRIIAVGTTTVRTLEAFAKNPHSSNPHPTLSLEGRGEIDLYITPGYKFKFVDAMITNFHLPQSSLLVLVSAFAGYNKTMTAYQTAINKKYRFYSFGDAMFII